MGQQIHHMIWHMLFSSQPLLLIPYEQQKPTHRGFQGNTQITGVFQAAQAEPETDRKGRATSDAGTNFTGLVWDGNLHCSQ
ncbi:hypothetical protein XELAEV_18012893mg [Xenopus laevis]|uniref:Uncharacterized protein n=1 Tax=Xenopus laevis TaxID=8355 RepID=A0A974HYV1_XENLA|nr:hypothetical protein XELAEV_18012893mg [Xenopus laevis]